MKKILILIVALFFIPVEYEGSYEIREYTHDEINNTPLINNFPSHDFPSRHHAIVYPNCGKPSLVEGGGNFTIILNFTKTIYDLRAWIVTAYEPVCDEIELMVEDVSENTIRVVVPQNTPKELYNLTLYIEYEGGTTFINEPRAVFVTNFSQNFTFAHLTDIHIGDPRGFKENVRESIGWRAVKKCIEEINLLHPEFVIITGDLVFGQLYPLEYRREYGKLYEILQKFDVPTFLCPGNHDGYVQCGQDGFKFWREYFGSLYHSFDYGKARFILINSYDWPKISRTGISYVVFNWGGYIGREQLRWIEEKMKEGELKCLFLHHNPLWDTKNDSLFKNGYEGRKELLSMIERYGVDAVFAGHVHRDDVTILNNTIFITTTTTSSGLGANDAYWGYRLIEIRNWSIVSYNYREPKYSIPSYRINYSYTYKEGEATAHVENNLDMEINAHLKFCIPSGEYAVKNGRVYMERHGENTEIYVISNIPPHSTKEITVQYGALTNT